MTTISKEDIDLAAEKFDYSDFSGEFRTSADGLHAFADHIATLARADLVAENEHMKDAQFKRLEREAEKRMELRTALAAAEAREEKLIDALDGAISQMTSISNGGPQYVDDLRCAIDAYTQPRDDLALREVISGVYEECANKADERKAQSRNSLVRSGLTVLAGDFRALAEKAKGK